MLEEPGGSFFSSGGMTMRQVKEEVCLYYMGFGICARGLHADKKGCCAGCSQYKASAVKMGKNSSVVTGKMA